MRHTRRLVHLEETVNIFEDIEARLDIVNLAVSEETALALRAQSGDNAAMMQLLRNYLPALKKAVARITRQSAEASQAQRDLQDLDDLRTAAIHGFIDAVHGFQPETGRVATRVKLRVHDRLVEARDARFTIEVPRESRRLFIQAFRAGGNDLAKGREHAPEFGLSPMTYDAIASTQNIGPAVTAMDGDPRSNGESHAASGEWDGDIHVRTSSMDNASEQPIVRSEDLIDASHALDALDARERLVIETIYGFGSEPRSVREAASILGIPRTTVQRIATAALSQMRTALGA